jgi:hypothetical protein
MLKRAAPKSHRIFHLRPIGAEGGAKVVEVENPRARVVHARAERARKRMIATERVN